MTTPLTHAPAINTSAAPTSERGHGWAWRSVLEAAAFVAVWVAIGWGPVRDPLAYLLLGIPLTAAFQVVVRRRPLAELWIRDGGIRRPPAVQWMSVTAVLAAVPLWTAWQSLADRQWMALAWATAACCGAAIGSAVVLQRRTPRARQGRSGRICGLGAAIGAVTTGAAVIGFGALPTLAGRASDPIGALSTFTHSTLLYLPALFVLEEVTFRGCLDAHLYPSSRALSRARIEPTGRGWTWVSALLSSWLWGLWHLPLLVAGSTPWYLLAPYLLTVHTLLGIPLALTWRRSGSLALPAAAHALIDGIRNALLTT